jgi:membrane fusion protein (multidrug efflux system)
MRREDSPIFREEALQYATSRQDGELLQLTPTWARWAYWMILAAFAAVAVYCTVGTLHEYASGPAVVWLHGRVEVTAPVAGTVSAIEVKPGQKVEAGQVLVRFSSPLELAELQRVDHEFDLQLAKSLRDPSDQAARAALTALRTQRDVAAARLEQLSIRAPRAGAIGDVRIRPGQLIEAGSIVLTLLGEDQRCSVMTMLPAQYRPQLHPGLTLRFEVKGYQYAYQEMVITSVGTQIIGPNEVKRYLGQEIGDTLAVEGPVVLVEATPTSPTFTVDNQTFEFYHGMNGVAEARVRTESILLSIVPGLRVFFGRHHD